jgi:hypothetical protein
MIRTRKAVRLLEWGEGTNTTNQIWTVSGEGKIVRQTKVGSLWTVWVEMSAAFSKKNTKDNTIKLAQLGEGMAANSERWGEVAVGVLKSVENGGRTVQIEIPTAAKFDTRRTVPAWEDNYN